MVLFLTKVKGFIFMNIHEAMMKHVALIVFIVCDMFSQLDRVPLTYNKWNPSLIRKRY